MTLKNKNKFRPIYKQLIKLKENLQNRDKLLRFKKEKWKKLIQIYKRKLNLYKKIKPKDQTQYLVLRYPGIGFSYKKQYKHILQETKKFKLIYGGLLTRVIKLILNKKHKTINFITFLKLFESRLDITLYRAKFGMSIRYIRQLIYHGKVFVNNKSIKIKSYILKPGDIVAVKPKYYKLLEPSVLQSTWPIYPKHLTVNYKTMQIIFSSLENNNVSLNLFYHLDLEKILARCYHC